MHGHQFDSLSRLLALGSTHRRALGMVHGRTAGRVALGLALVTIAALLAGMRGLMPAVIPVIVVLGPLLVTQYFVWRCRRGGERTTAAYLAAEPLRGGPLPVRASRYR